MKNNYKKQARKLLNMTAQDAEAQLKLIRKFNGDEEADKIVSEFSSALAEV